MAISERRKYPRIRIYSSISCIGVDSDGSCVGQYLGTVQNVSQIGLMIETFEELDADFAQLSIVDLENNLQECSPVDSTAASVSREHPQKM